MTSSKSRLRRWAENLGLLLFGFLLALVILEAGLRLAGSFVGQRTIAPGDSTDRVTLLTLGDSHTYGVFYSPADTYPGQLQAILDQRSPDRYHVVNLGLPGMNSSEIAVRLPRWIQRFRPYAVVVCVGINNSWNRSDTEEMRSSGGFTRWLASLRITRLGRLVKWNLQGPASVPEDTGRPAIQRVMLADGKEGVEHRDAETGELLIRHRGNVRERLGFDVSRELLRKDLQTIRASCEEWEPRVSARRCATSAASTAWRWWTSTTASPSYSPTVARGRAISTPKPRDIPIRAATPRSPSSSRIASSPWTLLSPEHVQST